MKIEVFGSENCKKCSKLKERIESVVESSDKNVEVEKVTDIERMANMGIMSTPAVAVNGELESKGKILDGDEIKELIS